MKIERYIQPNLVKSGVNKKNVHINKIIVHVNEGIQSDKLEINNKTTVCTDKHKQTLIAYGIKGEEKTLGTSKKK